MSNDLSSNAIIKFKCELVFKLSFHRFENTLLSNNVMLLRKLERVMKYFEKGVEAEKTS
jgi:hypothetical protein